MILKSVANLSLTCGTHFCWSVSTLAGGLDSYRDTPACSSSQAEKLAQGPEAVSVSFSSDKLACQARGLGATGAELHPSLCSFSCKTLWAGTLASKLTFRLHPTSLRHPSFLT